MPCRCLLFTLLFLLSTSFVGAGQLLKQGIAAFKAKEWEKAASILTQVHEEGGDHRAAELAYKASMYQIKQLIESKNFDKAIEVCRLSEAFDLSPEHSWAWVVHYNRGQALEGLGRPDEAKVAYEASLAAGGKDKVSVSFALGNIFFMEEDWAESIRLFQEALKKEKTPIVLGALGQAYYKNGELSTAIGYIEKALEASPGTGSLQVLLQKMRREHGVEGDFSEGMTSHFSISFQNTSKQRGAKKIVGDMLEDAYRVVSEDLGSLSGGRIQVVMYPSGRDYRLALATPTWTSALYNGKIRIPVELMDGNNENFEAILRHELTHHFVYQLAGRRCPMWVHEGLAQLMEKREKVDHRSRIRRIARDLKNVSEKGKTARYSISFKDLEAGWIGRLQGDSVYIAYAQAYYMMRFLDDAYGMRRITSYLEDLRTDTSRNPEEILERNFGVDYAEVVAELLTWLDNPANL